MDAASKAPNHSRPLHVLGVNLVWGEDSSHPDRHAMALQLFEDALDKHMPSTNVKADIYGNMALIQFHHTHNPHKAFANFKEALKIHPGYHKIRRDYVNALTLNREFDSALEQVDILLTKSGLSGRDLNLKGHVLLWLNRPQESLPCFEGAYPLLADKSNVMLNYAVALSMAGKHAEAEKLLIGALKQYPYEIPFYIAIIENSVRAGADDRALTYARQLLEQFDSQAIRSGIAEFSNNPGFAPLGVKPNWPQIEAVTSPGTERN
jgi:tetratricopeptide (TPR) repeat protein